MKTSTIVWIVVVLLIIIGVFIWYDGSGTQTAAPMQTATSTASAMNETLVVGADASGGEYLENAGGMTLYTYASDTQGTSTCSGDCAAAWPPYTVASPASLSLDPMASGTIGTIARGDGSLQVTYNGMPLYLYSGDANPGDMNGKGRANWSVAKP